MTDAAQTSTNRRGLLGVLVLAVPIVSILVVGTLYVAMFSVGAGGRDAMGDRVTVAFEGCDEARPVVASRLEAMGLPVHGWSEREGGFGVTLTLPAPPPAWAAEEMDPSLASEQLVPATLAATGEVVVRADDDGEVLVAREDVAEAVVEQQFLAAPVAVLVLEHPAAKRLAEHMAGHADGHVSVWLDGERISRQKNMPPIDDGRVHLALEGELSDIERIVRGPSIAIAIEEGPMPCPVGVADVSRE